MQELYDRGQYVLTFYVAGVAVESLFRAYIARRTNEFSSRHDLFELSREAKFGARVPPELAVKYAADLGAVAARWSNSHRYRSDKALRTFLKRTSLDRRIKGDALKENARRILNAAVDLVTLGDRIWEA